MDKAVTIAGQTVELKPGEAFRLQVWDDQGRSISYRIQTPMFGQDDGWASNILVECIEDARYGGGKQSVVAKGGDEVHGLDLEFGDESEEGRIKGRYIRIATELE